MYVGNGLEAAKLVNVMADSAKPLPLVSHWGVTGTDFATMAADALSRVDLRVLQTFSFLTNGNPAAAELVERYKARYSIAGPREIVAPVGTAHAYDLIHLLAAAIRTAGDTKSEAVRGALERLGTHVGLVKTYDPPFTPERHDALDASSFFLARYEGSTLVPIRE
ncbi:MAG: ABC-type branched-subunit amino acid transport system substrate-binding protein [Myxococcota bacterium]